MYIYICLNCRRKWAIAGWILFSLLMGWIYSSTLRSKLIVPAIPPSIDTLDESADSGLSIRVAFPYSYVDELWAGSPDPVHQKLYQKHTKAKEFRATVK